MTNANITITLPSLNLSSTFVINTNDYYNPCKISYAPAWAAFDALLVDASVAALAGSIVDQLIKVPILGLSMTCAVLSLPLLLVNVEDYANENYLSGATEQFTKFARRAYDAHYLIYDLSLHLLGLSRANDQEAELP